MNLVVTVSDLDLGDVMLQDILSSMGNVGLK